MSQFASLAHRNFSSILYGRNGKEVIEMSEKRATRVRNKYKYDVPLWHRPILSVAEATEYFGIGSNKIYELTEKENCPFVIWIGSRRVIKRTVPFPVSWTVKMKKKQKETQDILSYHTQAAGCSDKARAKASGGRQPIEECGRTGL